MKAIVLTRYGSTEVLQRRELPLPVLAPGKVLVRVFATTVNDVDWAYMRGKPLLYRLMFGLFRPKLRVLGAELAGVVEAVAGDVQGFRIGDRVHGDVSEAGLGGFAEYAAVPAQALVRVPDAMSFEQAASLPHAAMLAWQGLIDAGALQEGESLLINGAGGGVGTIGIQIARRLGAKATAVDSADKLPALLAAGFHHALDYRAVDFTRTGCQYDLILDTKTTRSPLEYLRALRPGGRYVTVGGSLLRLAQLVLLARVLRRLTGKRLEVVALKPNQKMDELNRMFAEQPMRPYIDGPYPLEQVPAAIERFGQARHLGKIVITVRSETRADG